MKEIKAIETRWRGYRFRSRLEARWAVFFESLKIKWEYEPEGYNLPSGPYLPDFFLPEIGCFVEIKPFEPSLHEVALAEELNRQLGHPIAFLIGVPDGRIRVFCYDSTDSSGGEGWWDASWAILHADFLPCLRACDGGRNRTFASLAADDAPFRMYQAFECNPNHDRIVDAIVAARSARFEHGESPL